MYHFSEYPQHVGIYDKCPNITKALRNSLASIPFYDGGQQQQQVGRPNCALGGKPVLLHLLLLLQQSPLLLFHLMKRESAESLSVWKDEPTLEDDERCGVKSIYFFECQFPAPSVIFIGIGHGSCGPCFPLDRFCLTQSLFSPMVPRLTRILCLGLEGKTRVQDIHCNTSPASFVCS